MYGDPAWVAIPARPADFQRHFWRPSGDGTRHAFRGRRWERTEYGTSICGVGVGLGEATEEDWITAPTCLDCNRALKGGD